MENDVVLHANHSSMGILITGDPGLVNHLSASSIMIGSTGLVQHICFLTQLGHGAAKPDAYRRTSAHRVDYEWMTGCTPCMSKVGIPPLIGVTLFRDYKGRDTSATIRTLPDGIEAVLF